jgi:hypothetical protein
LLEQRPLTALGEADIDLLMVEELHASPSFRSWFVDCSSDGEYACAEFVGAWRSVSTAIDESDFLMMFEATPSDSTVAFLVENKIRAEFQDRQPERYYERGLEGKNACWWNEFRTVLLAPQRYLDAHENESATFDFRISYEKILDWFAGQTDDSRYAFKAGVVAQALDPSTRVWNRVTDEITTDFFRSYEEICVRDFPALGLKRKPARSAQDYWMYFHNAEGVPKGIYIIHKCDRGFVDLTFQATGRDDLEQQCRKFLDEGMTIVQTGKSAVIRLVVAEIDHTRSFASQEASVVVGLEAAERLRRFCQTNEGRFS